MDEFDDKKIWDIVDNFEFNDKLEGVNKIEPSIDDTYNDQSKERIISITFNKLGIQRSTPQLAYNEERIVNKLLKRKVLLTASLLIMFLSTIFLLKDVRAEVRKLFYFIPGFSDVIEEEPGKEPFILKSPIVHQLENGQITVRSIKINRTHSEISLVGTLTPLKNIVLLDDPGNKYEFKQGTVVTSGEWTGIYYYNGDIHVSKEMKLLIDKSYVPVYLTKTKPADKIEDFGVTSIKNNIQLTAIISPMNENKDKVTVIPQTPFGMHIKSYGLSKNDEFIMTRLEETNGQLVTMEQDMQFPNPNEFYFYRKPDENYKLTIPALYVTKELEQEEKLSIPIPTSNLMQLNKKVTLFGHSVFISKVERNPIQGLSNTIRIYFEIPNENPNERLLFFNPDVTKIQGGGVSFKTNEKTQVLEYMDVEINPSALEQELFIKEAYFLVNGPWEFILDKDVKEQ